MSLDLSDAMAEMQSSNNNATEADTSEPSPDFESNEVGDLYLTLAGYHNYWSKVLKAVDHEALKVYSNDDLTDFPKRLGEHSDASPVQKMHCLATLAKYHLGEMQRANDHAVGLVDGAVPDSHDEVSQDFSYALHSKDRPAITTEVVDAGDDFPFDASDTGIDPTIDGLRVLTINGETMPLHVEDADDVIEAFELLNRLPDDPSTFENGELVTSSDPSIFADGDDTDSDTAENGGDSDTSGDPIGLAAQPHRVNEMTVSEIREQATDITNLRTIKTALQAEQLANNTRSSAVQRLKERRNVLQGEDVPDASASDTSPVKATTDGGSDESGESDASDDSDDEEMSADEVAEMFGFTDIQQDAMEFRVESGEADDYREAASQIAG